MQATKVKSEVPVSFAEARKRTAIPNEDIAWLVSSGAVKALAPSEKGKPWLLRLSKLRKAHREFYAIRTAVFHALKRPRH